MIGVLIVTHGRLGEALLETAGMLVSDAEKVRTLGIQPGQGVEDLEAAVRQALAELDLSEGVLCLVDLLGGSPAQVLGMIAIENPNLEVITGVNLLMLVETLLLRNSMDLPELAENAIRSGTEGITNLGNLLR